MARTKGDVLNRTAALLQQQKKYKEKLKQETKVKSSTDSVMQTRSKRADVEPQSAIESGELSENEPINTQNSDVPADGFVCNDCQKSYTSLSNLNHHIKISHDNGEGGVRRFACPYCDEEQSSKYSHKRHIERKHSDKAVGNLSENEYSKTREDRNLSNAAKNALLMRLKKENEKLKQEVACLKEKLQSFESTGISMRRGNRKLNSSTSSEVPTEVSNRSTKQSINNRTSPQLQKSIKTERRQTKSLKSSANSQKSGNKVDNSSRSKQQRLRKIKTELNTEDVLSQPAYTRGKRALKPKEDANFVYTS